MQDNVCKIQDTVNKCWESRISCNNSSSSNIPLPPVNDTISASVKWLSTPRPMTYAAHKDIVCIALII